MSFLLADRQESMAPMTNGVAESCLFFFHLPLLLLSWFLLFFLLLLQFANPPCAVVSKHRDRYNDCFEDSRSRSRVRDYLVVFCMLNTLKADTCRKVKLNSTAPLDTWEEHFTHQLFPRAKTIRVMRILFILRFDSSTLSPAHIASEDFKLF